MKKLLMVISLVILFCFTFGCQQGEEVVEEPAVDIAAEEAAVRAAFWANQKGGPVKDLELVFSVVADDVIFSGGDREAMYTYYTDYFSQGRYWDNSSLLKVEVSASGDLAYTAFSWENFSDEAGETSTGKGFNVMVWKKQADGTWKIVAL